MTWSHALEILSRICLLCGSVLCLLAALGLVRFPDLFSRMHAATKPQTLGVLLVLLGVGLGRRSALDIGMLLLVAVFQLATAPISSHLMGRAAVRSGQRPGVRADQRVPRGGGSGDPS